MNDQPSRPSGKRYSHVYMDRPHGVKNSERIRRRIASLFWRLNLNDFSDMASTIRGETGEPIPSAQYSGYDYWAFFGKCPLDTLLDTITVVAAHMRSRRANPDTWITEVERIFREEQAAYELDQDGGVHLRVDGAFQQARVAAIDALAGARYAPTVEFLMKAFDALNGPHPQPREACKNAFDSVETLFKLMSGQPRIGGREIRDHLNPLIALRYQADATALAAAQKMLRALVEWVDACHNYRHGPGADGESEPPDDLWQVLIGQAVSYLRWLAELDRHSRG